MHALINLLYGSTENAVTLFQGPNSKAAAERYAVEYLKKNRPQDLEMLRVQKESDAAILNAYILLLNTAEWFVVVKCKEPEIPKEVPKQFYREEFERPVARTVQDVIDELHRLPRDLPVGSEEEGLMLVVFNNSDPESRHLSFESPRDAD